MFVREEITIVVNGIESECVVISIYSSRDVYLEKEDGSCAWFAIDRRDFSRRPVKYHGAWMTAHR